MRPSQLSLGHRWTKPLGGELAGQVSMRGQVCGCTPSCKAPSLGHGPSRASRGSMIGSLGPTAGQEAPSPLPSGDTVSERDKRHARTHQGTQPDRLPRDPQVAAQGKRPPTRASGLQALSYHAPCPVGSGPRPFRRTFSLCVSSCACPPGCSETEHRLVTALIMSVPGGGGPGRERKLDIKFLNSTGPSGQQRRHSDAGVSASLPPPRCQAILS